MPPSVLIVSDVRLYREGLASILERSGRVRIVGIEAGVSSYLSNTSNESPDVVLLDARLLNAGVSVVVGHPKVKIVAFAVSEIEDDILACAKSGVSGVAGKDSSLDDILATIQAAIRGEVPCPSGITGILFRQLRALTRAQPHAHLSRGGLTRRELEVISLIDQGYSNKEIARQLGIGVLTVKNHVHNILEKLNVHRRGRAMAALRELSGSA